MILTSLATTGAFAQDTREFDPTAAASALEGQRFAVDPPSAPNPEDAAPREQRVTVLQDFVQSSAGRHERDRAYRRLIAALRMNRDRDGASEWQARWDAFVLEQEAVILREHAANPPVVALCTPPEDRRTLNFGGVRQYCAPDFAGDSAVADDLDLLARAADARDEHERRIALLETKLLLRWWRVPDQVRWRSLALEAADVGLLDAALRYCVISIEAPIYRAYPFMRSERPETEEPYICAAEMRFLMGDWEEWLVYYEPRLTDTNPRDIENLVRLCVASTRVGRPTARRSCNWAETSVRVRHNNENGQLQTARARARESGNEPRIALTRMERWQADKARYDAAIRSCERSGGETCQLEPAPRRRIRRI